MYNAPRELNLNHCHFHLIMQSVQINGAKRTVEARKLILGYPTDPKSQFLMSNEEMDKINPTRITATMPIATNEWNVAWYPSMTPEQMCAIGTAATNAQATEAGLSVMTLIVTLLERARGVAANIGGIGREEFWNGDDKALKKYEKVLQAAVKIVMKAAEGVEKSECHPLRSMVDDHAKASGMNTRVKT